MRKVTLIGDSIRLAYHPLVKKKLEGRAEVWGVWENGGNTRDVLANLDAWAIDHPADVIHLNCGLHDVLVTPDIPYQVPIDEYADNMRKILDRLKSETKAKLIWATTTPVIDSRHKVSGMRYEVDVQKYNAVAVEIADVAGALVNDLHGVIEKAGIMDCVSSDGCHMTDHGYQVLADAVAFAVMQ